MELNRTIVSAFGYVFVYRKSFAKALVIPVVLLVALGAISGQDARVSPYVFMLVGGLVYTMIAVTTHRIILLGPSSVAEWGIYVPTKREIYFILYSIGLGLAMLPAIFLGFIPIIGWIIAMIASFYILGRLSLVLPAVATDRDWTFTESWRATKEHSVSMMIVVGLFPLVLGLPALLLDLVPYMSLVAKFLSAVAVVLGIAALSVAFRTIAETYAANDTA